MPREYNNTIGESIYNRIKDYDMTSRKVFLGNLSKEHRELYTKYSNVMRKRKSLSNPEKRQTSNENAKIGMQTIRAKRPKEVQKEQRKPYDAKYELKRKEAAQVIQRKIRELKAKSNARVESTTIARDILNDIISNVPNLKLVDGEVKKKRGRKVQ